MMQALLQVLSAKRTSYADAFQKYSGVTPFAMSDLELAAVARTLAGGVMPIDPRSKSPSFIRDELLNVILAKFVEPQLGRDRPEIIYHYPASQAALAKTTLSPEGYEVAERFELYYRGVELANGYHELCDAAEQRRRFEAVNAARVEDGRPALPLPESLLAALERGLPDCTGVALGFDRLAMLAVESASIDEVLTYPASDAGD
jgi:lysyl-tRNA synthetase class 2